MPKVIVERVKFVMPRNHEYQFPAISTVQEFLLTWDKKMKDSDVSGGEATYELEWCMDMPAADLAFFEHAGLVLAKRDAYRDAMFRPDMLCDFSDERLERFKDSRKHVCQICQILCGGHNAHFLPTLRTVRPRLKGVWLSDTTTPDLLHYLLLARDNEVTGIIAKAGRETALAAALGLGVIEIIPHDRCLTWLSKFGSRYYRVIRDGDAYDWCIARAIASVEKAMATVVVDDETSLLDLSAGVRKA